MGNIDRNAIVFLCTELHDEVIKFANNLYSQTDLEVFVILDNNSIEISHDFKIKNDFSVLQVEDKECIDKGFFGCNNKDKTHINKQVIAWDKFFYFFCGDFLFYNFVWVFEEDVFIPSIKTIVNINRKYSNYDLVSPNNFKKSDNIPDWHWKEIFTKIQPPYFFSMVSACGISHKLLHQIEEFVNKNKYLVHHEVLLNTIANQSNLKIINPLELKSVVWLGDWGIDEFLMLPDNVFHPRKDIDNYSQLRNSINEHILSGYKPKKKLPQFLK